MKIVFFGTPEFGLSSVEACHQEAELVGVVTQPDRPRGRGQKLSPCPVRAWAQSKALPNFAPASLKKDSPELVALMTFLQTQKPDLFVVTAYGNLLPKSLIELPKHGSINLHGSLLPKWRGAAPIQRALEAGDKISGVCLQQMVFELDAGDVLAECPVVLDSNVDAIQTSEILAAAGKELLSSFLKSPHWMGTPQDEAKTTYAKKIEKSEGHWSPEWSPRETHNRVRAFIAWPGVKAKWQGQDLKIIKTRLLDESEWNSFAQANEVKLANFSSGDLILAKNAIILCGNRTSEQGGALELLEIQAPGKAPALAVDYFRNFKNLEKDKLKLEPQ